MIPRKHIFITSPPGGGKTTLIKKLLSKATTQQQYIINVLPGAFITEEIRDPTTRQRTGFQVTFPLPSSDKNAATITSVILASTTGPTNPSVRLPTVGKYFVNVDSCVDMVLVPAMKTMAQSVVAENKKNINQSDAAAVSDAHEEQQQHSTPKLNLAVIDEIGKMECLSSQFCATLVHLLDFPGIRVVATVAERGTKFIEQVKTRADVTVITVTPSNRDVLPDEILTNWLLQ